MAHIAILGGGPAGYVAAIRARQLGADVTLVEMSQSRLHPKQGIAQVVGADPARPADG